MKYIFIGEKATEKIVSVRNLQSSDFQESKSLLDFLGGTVIENMFFDLWFKREDDGAYILAKDDTKNKGIIFDLSVFSGFSNTFRNDQIITTLQKVLKFAVRYWRSLPLTTCERNIPGNKTIVFPFPHNIKNAYKVVIDRKPDSKRQLSRGTNFLLVIKDGFAGSSSMISYTVFRKAIEKIPDFPNNTGHLTESTGLSNGYLEVTNLDRSYKSIVDPSVGYDTWKYLLTKTQKDFVFKEINGPERLEGAAGTGKTLSLILRTIFLLDTNNAKDKKYDILFVTHSIATKNQIITIFQNNYSGIENYFKRNYSNVSLLITTLQEWCIDFLGGGISETEYLDIDAQDSKGLQLLYIEETFDEIMENHFDSYSSYCSKKFLDFIEETPKEDILEMLQQEIAVTIKGRAREDIDAYRELVRLSYAIPVEQDGDLNFLFFIFQSYQAKLQLTNQFDSDDIVLSALGQLNTPIWRRRRNNEGFSTILIDETHLFNFNELSVFHLLLRDENRNNIIFALDKSQAVGDRGLSDFNIYDSLNVQNVEESDKALLNTVFRSSPDIVNLAFHVLASGASLFTNFENPLERVKYSFTENEERDARPPLYIFKENDELMVITAFKIGEEESSRLNTKKSKIAIVSTSPILLSKLEQYADKNNKPYELIKRRGDLEVVKSAERSNRFIIAGIDFIGGLEFDSVIIIGVDKGRVPPTNSNRGTDSYHFLNYSWHNRMYVAITRAKYSILLIGEKSRGQSSLLENAIEEGVLTVN